MRYTVETTANVKRFIITKETKPDKKPGETIKTKRKDKGGKE